MRQTDELQTRRATSSHCPADVSSTVSTTSSVRSSMFWRSRVTLNHKFQQWRMFSIATGLNRVKTLRKQFTTSFHITRKPQLRQPLFCVEIHIRFRPPLLMETLHKYLSTPCVLSFYIHQNEVSQESGTFNVLDSPQKPKSGFPLHHHC